MRQLQLFTGTQVAAMRDRIKRRNYSPEAEEFRRDHERRRDFGLRQRHAERARQLRSGELVTRNGFLVHRHPASPLTETSERPPGAFSAAEVVQSAPAMQSASPAAPVDGPKTDKPLPVEGGGTLPAEAVTSAASPDEAPADAVIPAAGARGEAASAVVSAAGARGEAAGAVISAVAAGGGVSASGVGRSTANEILPGVREAGRWSSPLGGTGVVGLRRERTQFAARRPRREPGPEHPRVTRASASCRSAGFRSVRGPPK